MKTIIKITIALVVTIFFTDTIEAQIQPSRVIIRDSLLSRSQLRSPANRATFRDHRIKQRSTVRDQRIRQRPTVRDHRARINTNARRFDEADAMFGKRANVRDHRSTNSNNRRINRKGTGNSRYVKIIEMNSRKIGN